MHNHLPKKNNNSPMVGGMRRARFLLILTTALLVVGFIAFAPIVFTGAPRSAAIRIPRNATEQNVRDSLTKYFGQSFAKRTMHLLNLRHVDFSKRYGYYEIPEGMTPFNTMRRLGSGGQQPISITINGFRSLPNLAHRVSQKLNFSEDELLEALSKPENLAPYGLKPEQAMALFFDDTYEVYWTSTPKQFIDKIGEYYNSVWNATRRRKATNLGLTPADAIIICSITDEETNRTHEKGRISRLYLNRLSSGMKLQADPTVRFALNNYTIKRVTADHLNVDSPYNTYKNEGLPPGPIRTTSKTTLDALLNSNPSSDIYMCAKEDFSGDHNFTDNYETHLENAHRYQQALDSRGIK